MKKVVIAAITVPAASGAPFLLSEVLRLSVPAVAAPGPGAAGPAIPITVGVVKLADVPILLHAIGMVQAYNMVTIRSRVDGPIVKVDFTEGDEVIKTLQGPDGESAHVINKDGTVACRTVEVATVQDGIAVVSKGLQRGERVVVDRQYRLFEAARVRIEQPRGGMAG